MERNQLKEVTAMKKIILAALLLTLACISLAETIVPPGPVQGVWNAAGSPYRITGNIVINNNNLLTIEPGVLVIFDGIFKLDVSGQILCNGNEANIITFTAQDTLNGWQSIRFNNTSSNPPSVFTYTSFSFGKAVNGSSPVDPMNQGGAVRAINAGLLTFNYCNFNRCLAMGDGSVIYAENTNITMNNCVIKNCATQWFGALCIRNGAVNIQNSEFLNNFSDVFGACMYLYECPSVNISSSRFSNSLAGAVAGIYSLYSPLVITNSLFIGNQTDTGRGGAIGLTSGTATIINCTFADNTSPMDGGAIWFNGLSSPASIINSVFWDNQPDAISTITSTYTLSYCSMQVPQGGATNLWGDPQFTDSANGDYTLMATSFCIDAGTPDITGLNLPPLDLAGLPRVADGDMDTIARIDIGCYEMPAAQPYGTIAGQVTDAMSQPVAGAVITAGTASTTTNTWGLYSLIVDEGTYNVTCSKPGYTPMSYDDVTVGYGQTVMVNFVMASVSTSDPVGIPAVLTANISPNPFRNHVVFELSLPKDEAVKLEIYNLKGQKVRTLIDGSFTTGVYTHLWNGLDDGQRPLASGIYFYRLICGKQVQTNKLIKL